MEVRKKRELTGYKNFVDFADVYLDLQKEEVKNINFDNSRMAKKKSLDLSKRQPNYIEYS